MSVAICILEAGRTTTIAATAFVLSWTHSVEHVAWEEDWRVATDGLRIVEARVKGSGAGMEPPPDAVLRDGWWRYAPDLPPLPGLVLAASGATPSTWRLCAGGSCRALGASPGAAVEISVCELKPVHQ